MDVFVPSPLDDPLTENRVMFIEGVITSTMTRSRKELMNFALESKEPIRIIITSEGGAVSGASAFLDAMRAVQARGVEVVGIVQGEASSAALSILQGCDTRLAGEHALLMVHGSTGGLRGDKREQKALERYFSLIHDQMADLFAKRTRKTREEWLELFDDNLPNFFTPQEALEEGLIDRIV